MFLWTYSVVREKFPNPKSTVMARFDTSYVFVSDYPIYITHNRDNKMKNSAQKRNRSNRQEEEEEVAAKKATRSHTKISHVQA